MPFYKERYFENHKIMAVTDKLHKIYRNSSSPIVWARTVGVEVLNELTSLKAAMMFSAGAHSTNDHSQRDLTLFKLLTHGVELATGSIDYAKSLLKNLDRTVNKSV